MKLRGRGLRLQPLGLIHRHHHARAAAAQLRADVAVLRVQTVAGVDQQ